jgi:hypothetical protein
MTPLSVKRFLRTAALLDSTNDNERLTAARQASALLREAGLDWTQVLQAGLQRLGLSDVDATAAPAARTSREKFDDLFTQVRDKARAVVTPKASSEGEGRDDSFSAFVGDMFKGVSNTFSSVAKAVSEAATPAPAPSEISGPAIPAQIEGVPELIQEVRLEIPTLVFFLICGHHRYGPLIARDNLEQIHRAMQQHQAISGCVAPAAGVLDFPRFTLALT